MNMLSQETSQDDSPLDQEASVAHENEQAKFDF